VGPRAGLDDMERRKFLPLPGLELRLLGRPARNQLLYRQRYPTSKRHGFFIMVFPTTMIALALSVCCYSTRACLLFICTEIATRCLPTPTLTYLSLPTLVPRFRGLQCSDTNGVQLPGEAPSCNSCHAEYFLAAMHHYV
jgi:hypothetical protein